MAQNELATITEYGPPYWDDRAWDATRTEQRERRLFRALHTCNPERVLKQLDTLKQRYDDMAEESPKTRAFALDFVLLPEQWARHIDAISKLT